MRKQKSSNPISRLREIKKNAFLGPAGAIFQGMSTLAIGNIAGRIIGVVSIPILTRLYDPADFGVLAVFTAFILILAPFMTLRYVLALPLPRRDGIAFNLLILSAGIMGCMSLIVACGLWVFGFQLFSLFSVEIMKSYWWLIVVGSIANSSYEILSLWATRQRVYKAIARTTVLQSFLGNLIKIILGVLAIKPFGLLIGQIVASSGGIVSLLLSFNVEFKRNRSLLSWRRIAVVAGRYRNFPFYRLPSQLLLVFSMQAPVLFFASFYHADTTGQLSMALTIIALPMSLLGQSMSNAFYAETAKLGPKKYCELRSITKDVVVKLLYISVVPALLFFFWAPELFSFLLGSNWYESGEFASRLSLYLLSQFATAPIISIFNVIEKHNIFLSLNIIRVLGLIVVFFILPRQFEITAFETISIYSMFMALFYIGIYIFIMRYLKSNKMGT